MASNGRRSSTREELELHELLSPLTCLPPASSAVSGSNVASTSALRPVPPAPPPASINAFDIAALIRQSVMQGFKDSMPLCESQRGKRPRELPPSTPVEPEGDLPDVGRDAVPEDLADITGVFGEDVNPTPTHDISDEEEELVHTYSPEHIPSHQPALSVAPQADLNNNDVSSAAARTDVPVPQAATAVGEQVLDLDLPSVDPHPPTNCHPSQKMMAWSARAATKELTTEERKELKDRFNAAEEFDSLLLPSDMPLKLFKALKSPVTKKRDYLLHRQDIEKYLYYASSDLCAGLRPLIEAFTQLDAMGGMGELKNLVGQGVLCMMSANLRISRGRREVGRRFIRLDCAEALFAVPPSPRVPLWRA